MNDVVITGWGVVSAIGSGAEEFTRAYRARTSGLRPLTLFQSPHYRRDVAGEVPGFDPAALLGKKGLKTCDRSTLLLLAATELLYRGMGLAGAEARRRLLADEEVGIALGTLGSLKSIADFDMETVRAPQFVVPTLFPNTVFCAAASYAAIRYAFKESCVTLTNDEPSAVLAFGAGLGRLRRGRARQMVVGGTHELSDIWSLAHQKACERLGTPAPVLGEGAAVFALERREDAERRGARPLADVLGCASAFCPEKPAAFGRILERLRAQAGAEAVESVAHLFTAQKADLDEGASLPGAEVHRLYPRFGYLSAAQGAVAAAAALADDRIPAGAHVLVSTADTGGNCAALLLRKQVA